MYKAVIYKNLLEIECFKMPIEVTIQASKLMSINKAIKSMPYLLFSISLYL